MATEVVTNSSSLISSNGAYNLRTLLDDIPLRQDPDSSEDVYITTVDYWDDNLYIGTSAAELLHFVSIPGSKPSEEPAWILASRQQLPYSSEQTGEEKGVKQILVLPSVGKACILCNATLTFYTLPELSPAYGGKIQQAGCTWIGGLDLSAESEDVDETVIILCLRQRLRLIGIGVKTRKIRDIELGGVRAIQRRGDLACVADGAKYSLLDVVNQRMNELFPIASSSVVSTPQRAQNLAQSHPARNQSRSFSSTSPIRTSRGHERNTSLGQAVRDATRLRPDGNVRPNRTTSTQESSPSTSRPETPPVPPPKDAQQSSLSPNVVSPSSNEFLLTTGTRYDEPGVGLFVNLDGDVVRGTIEFSSYPDALILDDGQDNTAVQSADQERFILTLIRRTVDDKPEAFIELQKMHDDPHEVRRSKEYLPLPRHRHIEDDKPIVGTGLLVATSRRNLATIEISQILRQRRLAIGIPPETTDNAEQKRNDEEDKLAARFAATSTRILVFTSAQIAWAVRSSLVARLNTELDIAVEAVDIGLSINISKVQHTLNSIRGQEATSELEFVTLTYVRQRASLLLFGHLLVQASRGQISTSQEQQYTVRALEESDLDPRILLVLLPTLQQEIKNRGQGIWLSQGLLDTISQLRQVILDAKMEATMLQVVKEYLVFWRGKKGFGSIADEASVFYSVDAALLHILLIQDADSPRGPTSSPVRVELNKVVDKGVDCFDRAVELFTQFQRLYMLSRLYQSKKMSSQVLACWKRIMDGEPDKGGELVDGQTDVRVYLTKLRDKALVIEYGSYLANKNARLGVQVFADESARVTFTPTEAVAILDERAPGAVKDFLEYLVFGKNHVQYINDLIAFYLSTILTELTDPNSQATASLLRITQTYRALQPPKPSFSDFITDNAVPEEWWSNRLRLLQLIGGSHGAASRYDVHALRTQLEPHSNALVPEMIILNGREGKHEEAIHLLVAGLGDYDTAIRYCLLGGSSIFHPTSSTAAQRPPLPSREEQSQLFTYLLDEFLALEDTNERLERTAELLDRFGSWYDISQVLTLIPKDWTIEAVSGFLVSAFRSLVQERNQTSVAKALAGAQNLRLSAEVIEKLEHLAPVVVTAGVDVEP